MIDRAEIIRYLGAKTEDGISVLIEDGIVKAQALAPQHIVAEFDITATDDKGVTLSNGIFLAGKLAANSLKDCTKAIVLVATLTLEADIILSTAGSTVREAVYNATFSAAIEDYLDTTEAKLKKQYRDGGYYLTPRFSPGYGDLPLALQRDLLRATNAEKLLGIRLTEGLMLIPVKSVTAILGVSEKPFDRTEHKCDNCIKPCIYRKL